MPTTDADRPSFGSLLRFSMSRIFYPLWLLPVAVVAVLLPLYIDGSVHLTKAVSEPIAPGILGLGCLIAVIRWRKHRRPFLLWLAAMLAVFFIRELHFEGTSAFVYIGFLILMFIAWQQYPLFGDHMGGRLFLTLFSTTLFSYMIAVGLDNHWWKFLPGDKYQWAQVEEYVEIAGHSLLLLAALLARPVKNPLLQGADLSG